MPAPSDDDRRREPRAQLNLIVRIRASEPDSVPPWVEVATTADASGDGVSLLLDHPLEVGRTVLLQLLPPLPRSLGSIRLEGPSPEVWGVVRNARPEGGATRIGVQLLERPPELLVP
jgi:hypothetical protein